MKRHIAMVHQIWVAWVDTNFATKNIKNPVMKTITGFFIIQFFLTIFKTNTLLVWLNFKKKSLWTEKNFLHS